MTDIRDLVSPEEHTSQMVVQSSASSDLDSCLRTAAGQLWCFAQPPWTMAEHLGTDWGVQQWLLVADIGLKSHILSLREVRCQAFLFWMSSLNVNHWYKKCDCCH